MTLNNVPPPVSHSNCGRDFELMLERTHAYYLRAGSGRVEKISNAWAYCGEAEWRRLPAALKARTADGEPLKRQQTSCDYLGAVRDRGVAIDAKEFAGPSIPMAQFKTHQVRAIAEYARAGALAGFLVYSRRANKVYWLMGATFAPVYFMGSLKSLNIAWLDANALPICEAASRSATVDYAGVLIQ